MKTYDEFLSEAKTKWEPRSFPNTHEGAIDAFHHLATKSVHAKNRSDYKVSPAGPNSWLLSHPKKKFSAVVYPEGGDAHVGRKGDADFEEVDHDEAMKYHK